MEQLFSEDILTPSLLKSWLPHELHRKGTILFLQAFISTMVILVTAEFIPKTIFRIDPNTTPQMAGDSITNSLHRDPTRSFG